MKRENLMKNNTKLIMETWRRFLKEGPFMDNPDLESGEESLNVIKDEPDEGYLDDEYNPDGFNPDDSLDSPIAGEPPFENALPASDPDLSSIGDKVVEPLDNDYDEIPYTQEDAMMSSDERDNAFDERYDSNDELDDNPFGEDDGPF
jgi:hypothetical protein